MQPLEFELEPLEPRARVGSFHTYKVITVVQYSIKVGYSILFLHEIMTYFSTLKKLDRDRKSPS